MSADLTSYLQLITSEHRKQPQFIAFLSVLLQPLADNLLVLQSIPWLFDLDTAVGDQLDKVGRWIGLTRVVSLPLTDTYFSFDTPTAGFDLKPWWTIGDPVAASVVLDDQHYRLLLKARALNNVWDGSIPDAYEIWDTLFAGTGYQIGIKDFGDQTMGLILFYQIEPDSTTIALFEGGYLDIKPSTVSMRPYTLTTVPLVLTAVVGVKKVTLSWVSIAGLSYQVRQGTAPGGEDPTPIMTIIATGSTTTFEVDGLTTGTDYYFTVEAVDIFGGTVLSNEASATPT